MQQGPLTSVPCSSFSPIPDYPIPVDRDDSKERRCDAVNATEKKG